MVVGWGAGSREGGGQFGCGGGGDRVGLGAVGGAGLRQGGGQLES